jgi:hypothetical protein
LVNRHDGDYPVPITTRPPKLTAAQNPTDGQDTPVNSYGEVTPWSAVTGADRLYTEE